MTSDSFSLSLLNFNFKFKHLNHIARSEFGTFPEFLFPVPDNQAVLNHEFGLTA